MRGSCSLSRSGGEPAWTIGISLQRSCLRRQKCRNSACYGSDHAECRLPDRYLLYRFEISRRRLFAPARGGERRSRPVFYEKLDKSRFPEIMLYILNVLQLYYEERVVSVSNIYRNCYIYILFIYVYKIIIYTTA